MFLLHLQVRACDMRQIFQYSLFLHVPFGLMLFLCPFPKNVVLKILNVNGNCENADEKHSTRSFQVHHCEIGYLINSQF